MRKQWTKEQAWEWYHKQPWLRGCNFMGSDCCNRIDQWQEEGWPERYETAKRELRVMAEAGFNTIRIIMSAFVWQQQHDSYMEHLEQYIALADSFGVSVMIVFGNDCMVPKALTRMPALGKQIYDWGYHGGKKDSPHAAREEVGWNPDVDEPEGAAQFLEMAREIMGKYAQDPRVVIWDVFNEIGNGNRGMASVPVMRKLFALGWELEVSQPLTACIWHSFQEGVPEQERIAAELSDIINFHYYESYEDTVLFLKDLKDTYGRPLVNTEWLHRIQGNTVQELFPLFYLENVGNYMWGCVAGASQTYEPWEGLWQMYARGEGEHLDFTKWQHDFFRPSLRPYDPKELALVKKFCALADADWARKKKD